MRLLLIGLAAAAAGAAEAQQVAPQPSGWAEKADICTDRTHAVQERIEACTVVYSLQSDREMKAYALWFRADARLEAGDFDGAIADADEADQILPGDTGILNARCWTRAVANRELDLARGACDLSLRKKAEAGTYDSRGLLNLREGAWQAAWDDYDEAFSLEPTLSVSLYGRGLAALALGRVAEGENDLRRAPSAKDEFRRFGLTPESIKARAEAAN